MKLRAAARRLVVGTQLEGPAKQLHYLLTRSKSSLYDVQTIEIMRRVLTPTSLAVDVGAFEGSMLRHMLRFAPRARHHAFEPIPRLCQRLQARFPSCEIHAAALGAVPGVQTFYEVEQSPALSGLRKRIDLPASTSIREYSVEVQTLDQEIPPSLPVELVKIDVEGGELGVLRGGVATLRRCRPIVVFECGLGGADSYGSRPADLFDFVNVELSLKLFLLRSWLERRAQLSKGEFVQQFEESLNYYFVAAP